MKTALQTIIDEFYKEDGTFGNDTMISRTKIVSHLRSHLPLEREQITQAYGDGLNPHRGEGKYTNRDEYFDYTFNEKA